MFKLESDEKSLGALEYDLIRFSGGELQPRLKRPIGYENVTIRADIHSPSEIMELVLLVDAIRRSSHDTNIYLVCPYLPYARQDRVCAVGEALGLKVMCDIINSLKFELVTIWDVHSDVALALLDRVANVHQKELIGRIGDDLGDVIFVSPDAGASKKTLAVANKFNRPMVQADKIRSVIDGSITGTVVHSGFVNDQNFFVVDDICDGGRTFLELSKPLRGLTNGKLFLYVTHGIFSKGIAELLNVYDHIYTANPFPEANWSSTGYTILKG